MDSSKPKPGPSFGSHVSSKSLPFFSWVSSRPILNSSSSSPTLQPSSAPASIISTPLRKSPSVSSSLANLPSLLSISASVASMATPLRSRRNVTNKSLPKNKYDLHKEPATGSVTSRVCHRSQLDELLQSFKRLESGTKESREHPDEAASSSTSSWESAPHSRHMASCPPLTPLAAPASPRPIRCFNASPRPWVAKKLSAPICQSAIEEGKRYGGAGLPLSVCAAVPSAGKIFAEDSFAAVNKNNGKTQKEVNRTAEILKGLREIIAKRRFKSSSNLDREAVKCTPAVSDSVVSLSESIITKSLYQSPISSVDASLDFIDADTSKDITLGDTFNENQNKSKCSESIEFSSKFSVGVATSDSNLNETKDSQNKSQLSKDSDFDNERILDQNLPELSVKKCMNSYVPSVETNELESSPLNVNTCNAIAASLCKSVSTLASSTISTQPSTPNANALPNKTIATDRNKLSVPTANASLKNKREHGSEKQRMLRKAQRTIRQTLEKKFYSNDDIFAITNYPNMFKKSPILLRSNGHKKDKPKNNLFLHNGNHRKAPHLQAIARRTGRPLENTQDRVSWRKGEGEEERSFSKFRRPGDTPPKPSVPRSSSAPSSPSLQHSTMFSCSSSHPLRCSASSADSTVVQVAVASPSLLHCSPTPLVRCSVKTDSADTLGGSGDGDRAPPVIPSILDSKQTFSSEITVPAVVHRKPDHDNLAKRRKGHISPLNTSTASPSDASESTTPFVTSASGGSSPKVTVNHILASLNFARFRLGDFASSLGSSKKDNAASSGTPPVRPPRTRHDQDKTRKFSSSSAKSPEREDKGSDGLGWRRRRSATEGGTSIPSMLSPSKHSLLTRTKSDPQHQKHIASKKSTERSEQCLKKNAADSSRSSTSKLTDGSMTSRIKNLSPVFRKSSGSKAGKVSISMSEIPNVPEEIKKASVEASSKSLLPPKAPESRLHIRDFPFRTASVSQTDLNNEGLKEGRTSPSLRVFSLCKDGKHNTLPRRKTDSHEESGIAVGGAVSYTDFLSNEKLNSNFKMNTNDIKIDRIQSSPYMAQASSFVNVKDDIYEEICDNNTVKAEICGSESKLQNAGAGNVENSDLDDRTKRKSRRVVFGLWPSGENVEGSVKVVENKKDEIAPKFSVSNCSESFGEIQLDTNEVTTISGETENKMEAHAGNSNAVKSIDMVSDNNEETINSFQLSKKDTNDKESPMVTNTVPLLISPVFRGEVRRGSLPCSGNFPHSRQNFDPSQNENARESIIQAVSKLMNRDKMSPTLTKEFSLSHRERNLMLKRGNSFDYYKLDHKGFGDFSSGDKKSSSHSAHHSKYEKEQASINPVPRGAKSQISGHKCLMRSDGIDILTQEEIETQFEELSEQRSFQMKDSKGQETSSMLLAKEKYKLEPLLLPQLSDEGISVDEIRRKQPLLTSDSSSQDSVGLDNYRHHEDTVPAGGEDEHLEKNETDLHLIDRVGSMMRKENLECSQSDHSITFSSPQITKNDMGYSSIDSNGLKSLSNNTQVPGDVSEGQSSSVSLADSFFSEGDESNIDTDCAMQSKNFSDTGTHDKNERKLKYYSDPRSDRTSSSGTLGYMMNNSGNQDMLQKCVLSQTSSDSEGKDEMSQELAEGQFVSYSNQFSCRPQVLLTGTMSDPLSERAQDIFSRNSGTNSPSFFLDSDSGEFGSGRSPQGPRRYSKRPLRGPYGEMLEAEMSKTKSNYLTEETYLAVRDSKSSSPCPPTLSASESSAPLSPATSTEQELQIPCTSLDDSTIRMFYSEHCRSMNSPPSVTSCSSESASELLPLKLPAHQRTKSSPSKLFCEPPATFEENQQHSDYYKAAVTYISREQQHPKTCAPRLGINPFTKAFQKSNRMSIIDDEGTSNDIKSGHEQEDAIRDDERQEEQVPSVGDQNRSTEAKQREGSLPINLSSNEEEKEQSDARLVREALKAASESLLKRQFQNILLERQNQGQQEVEADYLYLHNLLHRVVSTTL